MSSIDLMACIGGSFMMAVPGKIRLPSVALGMVGLIVAGDISGSGGSLAGWYLVGFIATKIVNRFILHVESMIQKKDPEKEAENPKDKKAHLLGYFVLGDVNQDGKMVFSNDEFAKKANMN